MQIFDHVAASSFGHTRRGCISVEAGDKTGGNATILPSQQSQ